VAMFTRNVVRAVQPTRFLPTLLPSRTFAAKSKELDLTIDGDYKFHKCDGLGKEVKTSSDELIHAFKVMYAIRRMEQGADKMYKARKIQGFLHLYNGQEAVVSGIEAALTREDSIITAYRDHGFAYTRGCTIREVYAELMGKVTGCSKGNGGSMHMYSKKGNFYGGNGIVGAQCPVGAGVAFSHKYRQDGNVCVALYGDGAANQGQIFEAYNMSLLWKLPVIYVCENNKYGMGTSVARASSNVEFYQRGDFVPGIQVDGMDFLAVRNAVDYAKKHALKNGPIILEMVTYRYVGHSMSDPGTTYRTREEIDTVRKQRDPIERLRARLIQNELCDEKEIKEMEKAIRAEVDDAMNQVNDDSFPPEEQAFQNIYWNEQPAVRTVEFPNFYRPS